MFLNKIQLIGNVTRLPELRALPSGQTVTTFTLATNRTHKNPDGQQVEHSEFHSIVAFGKQADILATHLRVGSSLYVEGRVQTRTWEEGGLKKYRTETVVERFQFGASAPAVADNIEAV